MRSSEWKEKFLYQEVYQKYTMESAIVKLHKETKDALDRLKETRESYDHVIRRLLSHEKKRSLRKDLIEAYESMTPDEFDEFQKWESASSEA